MSSIRFGIGCGEEGHQSSGMTQCVNSPLDSNETDDRRSPDLFVSSPCQNSAYYMAATERVEARRTPSCPKDRWSTTATKETKSSDEKKNEMDAKAGSTRHSPSSSRRDTQRMKERKILVFATSESENGD